MKFKIHKKTKKAFILVLVLLIILSSLKLFITLLQPRTTMSEKVEYGSTCNQKAAYRVIIHENEVYPGTVLEEGRIYSKRLLNYIQAEFNVDYSGTSKVPLDIEYQIIATVNGYSGSSNDIYWSKTFPLTNKKNIKEVSGVWSKQEKVNFQLAEYDSFAVKAKSITGMDVSNELIVTMKGNVIAHADNKELETPFEVGLQIPLAEDIFEITKLDSSPIQNSITISEEIAVPLNLKRILFYSTLLLLSVIGIIILIFYTREPNEKDILKKKVNSTLKNYGSRIVAIQSIPMMNYSKKYIVHSIKDLIKIADEVQKPIYYEIDADTIVKRYELFVIENDSVYSLFLDDKPE
jgi:hypothetical protein